MKNWLSIGIIAILVPSLTLAQTAPKAAPKSVPEKQEKKVETKKKSNDFEIEPALSFKPDSMIKEVSPGTTINEKILVKNNEDVEFQAQVIIVPIYTNAAGALLREEQTKPVGKNKNAKKEKFDILPFIKDTIIPEKIVTLKPKQVTAIPVSFKVPDDAKGSFYFMYSIQPVVTELNKIRMARIKKAGKNKPAALNVALQVYSIGAFTVKGKSNVDVSAKNQLKYIPATKQVLLQSQLSNKGNDFVRSYKGTGVISKDGKAIARFDIKPVQSLSLLLPNKSLSYAGSVEAGLQKGSYDVVLTFVDATGTKISTFKETLKVN